MTEKELHKLSRHDLLHLLLTEVKENGSLHGQLDEVRNELEQTRESNDRLKIRINDREEQVQRLKEKLDKKDRLLDKKDAYISELEGRLDSYGDGNYVGPGGFGSLAEATLQLNGVFEAAQSAADQYINSIKAMYEKMAATKKIPENGVNIAEILQNPDSSQNVDKDNVDEDNFDKKSDNISSEKENMKKAENDNIFTNTQNTQNKPADNNGGTDNTGLDESKSGKTDVIKASDVKIDKYGRYNSYDEEDIMDLNNDSIVDLDEKEKKEAEKVEREAKMAAYEDDWAQIESERSGTS
jgi:hypothetical protein